MKFIFNHHLRPQLDCRPIGARLLIWVGLFLIIGLVGSTVSGQQFPDQSSKFGTTLSPTGPHQFSDTPSPTEMMARLKLHKQQDTPLFDLLREAGVDIFSKLSDDEKKLAGRFVEDMILKEGLDSERFSSLMEKMNIGDDVKQALQESLERAGVDESATSPEQRKQLADKIRKDFLQGTESQRDAFRRSANQNQRQSQPRNAFGTNQARQEDSTRREEFALPRADSDGPQPLPIARANHQAWKNYRA